MSVLQTDECAALEQLGAEARARGVRVVDNPYLKTDALPERTGEDVSIWGEKTQAWARGWHAVERNR